MTYQPGQRVRTTVDQIGRHMPAGSLGTVIYPPNKWGGYGVHLDDDPSGGTHAYCGDELAPADADDEPDSPA